MTKNPAEIAGTRYKNEKLMSRMQKTDGTSRCFAQSEMLNENSKKVYENCSYLYGSLPRWVGIPRQPPS